MSFLSIKIDSKAVEKRLEKISKGVKDYEKPLKESSKFSLKLFTENFKVRGREFGEWKKLSPATLKAKARLGFPSSPLIGTGRMMKSFKVAKTNKFVVTFHNTAKYFKYHQLGGRKIPKRVMMGINKKMTKKIASIFKKHIKNLLR